MDNKKLADDFISQTGEETEKKEMTTLDKFFKFRIITYNQNSYQHLSRRQHILAKMIISELTKYKQTTLVKLYEAVKPRYDRLVEHRLNHFENEKEAIKEAKYNFLITLNPRSSNYKKNLLSRSAVSTIIDRLNPPIVSTQTKANKAKTRLYKIVSLTTFGKKLADSPMINQDHLGEEL